MLFLYKLNFYSNSYFSVDSNYTYFVKGDNYFKFDNYKVQVEDGYPHSFKSDWLKCDSPVSPSEETKLSTVEPNRRDDGSASKLLAILCVCIISVALVIAGVSYVMWRRQRRYRKSYRSTKRYSGGRIGTSVHVLDNGGKTVCVTSVKQKWRLMRFSLQGKVWYYMLFKLYKLLAYNKQFSFSFTFSLSMHEIDSCPDAFCMHQCNGIYQSCQLVSLIELSNFL